MSPITSTPISQASIRRLVTHTNSQVPMPVDRRQTPGQPVLIHT